MSSVRSSMRLWLAPLGLGVMLGVAGLALVASRRGFFAARKLDVPAPACIGDRACAVRRAEEVRARAKERWNEAAPAHAATSDESDARWLGQALRASLERDDCDAAMELSGGLERLEVNRAHAPALADAIDAAVLGRKGYCAMAKSKAIDAPPPGSSIRLERGACYGECPVYIVTVSSEGVVTFDGAEFTAVRGPARGAIAPSKARELFDAFERMAFAKRPPHVGEGITDMATATLTLARGSVVTTVTDRATCWTTDSIEEGICYLEGRTDEIAQTHKWVRSSTR